MADTEEVDRWLWTECAEVWNSKAEEFPKQNMQAYINPVLPYVEVVASSERAGTMIRLSKEEFRVWVKRCQDLLDAHDLNGVEGVRSRFPV